MKPYIVFNEDDRLIITSARSQSNHFKAVIPTGDITIFEKMLESMLKVAYQAGRNDTLREIRSQRHAH